MHGAKEFFPVCRFSCGSFVIFHAIYPDRESKWQGHFVVARTIMTAGRISRFFCRIAFVRENSDRSSKRHVRDRIWPFRHLSTCSNRRKASFHENASQVIRQRGTGARSAFLWYSISSRIHVNLRGWHRSHTTGPTVRKKRFYRLCRHLSLPTVDKVPRSNHGIRVFLPLRICPER